MNLEQANRIFKIAATQQEVICPPEQVFKHSDLNFLFDHGGGLVEDKNQYKLFTEYLRKIGEDKFYILENIGATLTERTIPFKISISLSSHYELFQEKVLAFEPPFGWRINHFFIFGQSDKWGIYMCEYPTINIIGCVNEYKEGFKKVFSINRNGYTELKELIAQEFKTKPNLMSEFTKQYSFENRQH